MTSTTFKAKSYLSVVAITVTVVAAITSAVVMARTAARVKVGQTKVRRSRRTPANAVPVFSSGRVVAMVRVSSARQCDNSGCDDKSCGSKRDTHGFRPLGYIVSIAE
jgi:hypothetical protein